MTPPVNSAAHEKFFAQRPTSLAIVGLGPSANAFWLESSQFDAVPQWDTVWVVNRGMCSFRHDATFEMHDLRRLTKKYPNEVHRFVQEREPIVCPDAYPEFPMTVRFPVDEVLQHVQHDFLNSTPAHMLAYAMLIGVKAVWLYGCDFHYVNIDRAEAGGQGMAFLLGQCHERGIQYHIPNASSLLDAYRVKLVQDGPKGPCKPIRPLYGYSSWDHASDVPDPRIPAGGTLIDLKAAPALMTAQDKPYQLGEAEAGDKEVARHGG